MSAVAAQFALRLRFTTLNPVLTANFRNSLSCTTLKSIRLFNSTFFSRNYSLTAVTSSGRLYSDKHEWVEVENGIGTVGISQYAQEALGDVVFAQLPEPGTEVNKDDEVGALESVKAASELYSPVSGCVTEKNKGVEDTPALINQSCYDKGWLFKLKLKDVEELKGLMDEAKYKDFLRSDEASATTS